MFKKMALAAAAILSLGLFAFLVITADVMSPRSARTGYFAVRTSNEFDLSALDEWKRAAKEKYGDAVQTPVRMNNGGSQWEARLDNTTLEIKPLGRTPITAGVLAVDDPSFAVYGPNGDKILFPFVLRSGDVRLSEPAMSQLIKRDFEGSVPATFLAFDESGWRLGACHRPDVSTGGSISNALFQPVSRDVCFVERTDGSGPVLIGTAVVKGGWVWPFGRTTCRGLGSDWLNTMRRAEPDKAPQYVGCLLVAPGAGTDAPILVSAQFFEVQPDQTLAKFRNWIW